LTTVTGEIPQTINSGAAPGAPAQNADPAPENFRRARAEHWDRIAGKLDHSAGMGGYYHRRLIEIYRTIIPTGLRILEIGCGQGDLLAALEPSTGVGIDISGEMISRAQKRHPNLQFHHVDAMEMDFTEPFDAIVLSDSINDLWDVQAVFERMRKFVTPRTRIAMNFFSRVWELPLRAARKVGLAQKVLTPAWLTIPDVANLLNLSGFEMIRQSTEIAFPLRMPLVDAMFNRFLVKIPPFSWGGMTNFVVARPAPVDTNQQTTVSVVVPARNEAGNVPAIFSRIPEIGLGTEIIFVEGHSSDDTYAAIEQAIAQNPQRNCKLLRQTGKGKGDAVRAGFAAATGDILMILDADLTTPPEDLPRFYEAIRSGKGEFVNGVRLVYPMERQAMQFLNLLANKFFGLAFTWLLGQSLRDTLCGTKVLRKTDYLSIVAHRAYFGDFDPFGDFDLLFGAAKLNLKMVDLPVRYRERTYGSTNIQRFKHGWLLLRMMTFAAGRIKFV
jgi:ubiquinone/menaquinone biosynthesis C-methylase UbiE